MTTNKNDAAEVIERLLASLEQCTSPEIARMDIESRIETLRKLYRSKPYLFTQESIETIRRVKNLIAEIEVLGFLIDDAVDAKTQEQASEIFLNLAKAAQALEGTKPSERARAVMRELRERLPTLRSESLNDPLARLKRQAMQQEMMSFREQAQKAVENLAPTCPRCRTTMSLRTGVYGDFWGCNFFPDCLGKLPLSEKARMKLAELRRPRIEIAYDAF